MMSAKPKLYRVSFELDASDMAEEYGELEDESAWIVLQVRAESVLGATALAFSYLSMDQRDLLLPLGEQTGRVEEIDSV